MREWQSQSHVRWYGRYHVVWVPKYRKRAIFGEMRRGIGRIVRERCQRQGVELELLKCEAAALHWSCYTTGDETEVQASQ